jgi:NAD(P)-dependent dehydrogenase (short-subunit alcohol dehydrogenase family)
LSIIQALTQATASEAKEANIWVNAIAPSIIDTPANREAMPDEPHEDWPSTEDVAATVLFLASPENRVTRGGVVPVYGRS